MLSTIAIMLPKGRRGFKFTVEELKDHLVSLMRFFSLAIQSGSKFGLGIMHIMPRETIPLKRKFQELVCKKYQLVTPIIHPTFVLQSAFFLTVQSIYSGIFSRKGIFTRANPVC